MTDVFVGDARRRIVDDLVAAFERVAAGEGPEVVALVSPPGWGKTRIVQELYARLAAAQPEPRYWPPALLTGGPGIEELSRARKNVYPREVVVPAGAELPWMWWGILCARRASGELSQAMFDDATQLYAHAEALMREPADARGVVFDAGSALVDVLGLLGLAVPPVGAALTVVGAVKVGWENRHLVARLREWRAARREEERVVAPTAHGREAAVEELVRALARLTRERPLVIVLDDAHFADETLVAMLAGLLESPQARVLVVATAWPAHVDAESEALPFAAWLRTLQGRSRPVFARVDLEQLGADDVAVLVEAELPAAGGLADDIGRRYGSNLLAIRSVLRLPRVRRAVASGELGRGAEAALPARVEDVFEEYWADLPEPVRIVLSLAAQRGARYLPNVVAAAAEAAAIVERARERLAEGVSPYAWVRELDRSLHAFVEPVLRQIARQSADELVTEDDVEALHRAIVDAAPQADESDLSPAAREELLEQHVALAKEGLASQGDAAAASALALADVYATRYAYRSGARLAALALGWSSLPPEHPDTLRTRSNLASWLGRGGGWRRRRSSSGCCWRTRRGSSVVTTRIQSLPDARSRRSRTGESRGSTSGTPESARIAPCHEWRRQLVGELPSWPTRRT